MIRRGRGPRRGKHSEQEALAHHDTVAGGHQDCTHPSGRELFTNEITDRIGTSQEGQARGPVHCALHAHKIPQAIAQQTTARADHDLIRVACLQFVCQAWPRLRALYIDKFVEVAPYSEYWCW